MWDFLAKLRPDNIVDLMQTAVLLATVFVILLALHMVRQVFQEGVKLLRDNLDHIRRIEARLAALEKRDEDDAT
jgi:hypothetical protein